MKKSFLWRVAIALFVLGITAIYLIPSLVFFTPPGKTPVVVDNNSFIKKIFPDANINLGLDLMGGIHLTLGVEVEKAIETSITIMGQDIVQEANSKGFLMAKPKVVQGTNLEFILTIPEKKSEFEEMMSKGFSDLKISDPVTLGGGNLQYTASLKPLARKRMTDQALDQALTTIRNRIDQFGVAEPDIRKQQGNRIVVQLPGMDSTQRAISIIGKTAHLEFRLIYKDISGSVLPNSAEYLPFAEKNRNDPTKESLLAVEKEVALTGEHITDARVQTNTQAGGYGVSISFDKRGKDIFARITRENVGKRLAIILDGKIHSAPVINTEIYGDASITGNFTYAEASDLALILRAGSLPAPVHVLEERTVGPSLGQESIDMGITAALIGCITIMVFMAVYYGLPGIIANVMLLFDIALILAGMAFFGATLTLPGIAGIVLTLGMAIDANVLIFERMREELKRGTSAKQAVDLGFSQAQRAIIDSNLTSIIATVILYELGTGPIRGFAVTLTMGIIASMFTAVFVSRIIFDFWMRKESRKLNMGLRLIPDNLNFNFIGVRKISYILSIIIILIGMASLVYKGGLRYGIDFAGGATVQVKFDNPISDETLKKSLESANLPGLAVQSYGTEGTTYILRISTVAETSSGINKLIQDTLTTHLNGASFTIQKLDMVGPKVGADLRAKAVEAIYFAILFTAVYISGRFENRWFTAALMATLLAGGLYGLQLVGIGKEYLVFLAIAITIAVCVKLRLVFALGTILSILHDVLITVGIFTLLDKEFDLTIIAAILTVVGYSLNDTIIVYDRIRENLRNNKEDTLSTIINRSINQTISRTILTSGSTLLVILSLLFFGGSMLYDFALIMCIGVVVGTLSSMFVASPILLVFGDKVIKIETKQDKRPRDSDGRLAPQV